MTYTEIFSSTGKKQIFRFEMLCKKGRNVNAGVFTTQICEYRQIAGNKEERSEGVAK